MAETSRVKVLSREAGKVFEQVVMGEMLIPDVPNVYGDIMTREAIKEFVYAYAMSEYGIDVDHDEQDVKNTKAVVVESFIARPGDPDFIEGSWVVGMKILDSELWQKVLDGEINGFSFYAECYMLEVIFQNLRNRQVTGETEPDPIDGHTHTYLVMLTALNRPIYGATGVTDGHSHRIVSHTVTEKSISVFGSGEHSHRYQVIVPDVEVSDE